MFLSDEDRELRSPHTRDNNHHAGSEGTLPETKQGMAIKKQIYMVIQLLFSLSINYLYHKSIKT